MLIYAFYKQLTNSILVHNFARQNKLKIKNLIVLKIGGRLKCLFKVNKKSITNQLIYQLIKFLKGMTYVVSMVLILPAQ